VRDKTYEFRITQRSASISKKEGDNT